MRLDVYRLFDKMLSRVVSFYCVFWTVCGVEYKIADYDPIEEIHHAACEIATKEIQATANATITRSLKGVCTSKELSNRLDKLERKLLQEMEIIKSYLSFSNMTPKPKQLKHIQLLSKKQMINLMQENKLTGIDDKTYINDSQINANYLKTNRDIKKRTEKLNGNDSKLTVNNKINGNDGKLNRIDDKTNDKVETNYVNERNINTNESTIENKLNNLIKRNENGRKIYKTESEVHINESKIHNNESTIYENERKVHKNETHFHKSESQVHKNEMNLEISADKNASVLEKNPFSARKQEILKYNGTTSVPKGQRDKEFNYYWKIENVAKTFEQENVISENFFCAGHLYYINMYPKHRNTKYAALELRTVGRVKKRHRFLLIHSTDPRLDTSSQVLSNLYAPLYRLSLEKVRKYVHGDALTVKLIIYV